MLKVCNKDLRRSCIFILFLLVFSQNADGQDCTIHHYTVNDGLSQSSVYLFNESNDGYIWIGTGDGLNFFDGYTFTVFKYDPEQKGAISNGSIRSLTKDKNGKLFIGTDQGLNYYDSINQEFVKYTCANQHLDNSVYVICIKNDTLYCNISGKGVYKISLANQIISPVDTVDNKIKKIIYTSNDLKVCFLDNNRIGILDLITKHVEKWAFTDKTTIGIQPFFLNDDNFAITTDHGLKIFNIRSHLFKDPSLFPCLKTFLNKPISAICRDHKNQIWISVKGKGIYTYTESGSLLKYYGDQTGYPLKNVTNIYADRQNNIWAGTDDAGFYKISPEKQKFGLTTLNKGNKLNVKSDFIKCFLKSGDDLLVGTFEQGLYVINNQKGTKQIYTSKNGLYSNTINSIFKDREGIIWLCTENGINIYEPSGKITKAFSKKRTGTDNYTPFIIQNQEGLRLIRLDDSIYPIQKKGNKWVYGHKAWPYAGKFLWQNSNGDYLTGFTIRDLICVHRNTADTLSEKMRWPHYYDFATINCVYKSFDQSIWIATSAGVIKLSENYNFIKYYGQKEGLPDNHIYGILGDSSGKLWMSTNKGLSCFNLATGRFRNYSVKDGIQSAEFNSGAYYRAPDDEMFFGGVDGFNNFYPEKIKDNPHVPVLKLIGIKLFDKDLNPNQKPIQNRFPADENAFSFEVSGIEFMSPEDNQYAFKLEGADKNWYFAGTKRNIRYSGLAQGKYVLWGKASNSDGIWSAPVVLYHFEIIPPWWSAWWVKFLAMLVVLIALIFATRYISIQKLRKQLRILQREKEIEKIRSRISSDIHDDIGAGLSRIARISENTANKENTSENIKADMVKLSQSSRELLSSLGEIVWAINPRYDELESLQSYLRSFAYDYFAESGIEINIEFQTGGYEISFEPETRRNIFLIVKEALHNILKYASATRVDFFMTLEKSQILFVIKDNGKGINSGGITEFGNGLINMKNRSEEMGGSFEIISAPDAGTTLKIRLNLEDMLRKKN